MKAFDTDIYVDAPVFDLARRAGKQLRRDSDSFKELCYFDFRLSDLDNIAFEFFSYDEEGEPNPVTHVSSTAWEDLTAVSLALSALGIPPQQIHAARNSLGDMLRQIDFVRSVVRYLEGHAEPGQKRNAGSSFKLAQFYADVRRLEADGMLTEDEKIEKVGKLNFDFTGGHKAVKAVSRLG